MKHWGRLSLGVVLILGTVLRLYGLDWGTDRRTGTFHRFHPDEATLIDGAALVGQDLKAIQASYGKAPMYLLYGVAHAVGRVAGQTPFDMKDNRSVRFTHRVGRTLSALMGVLTVWLIYLIGLRLNGPWTGVLSALFLAFLAGHIQQSHFFTVDVPLTFWVTLALYLLLALPSERFGPYLGFGATAGLAAGTRLIGIWLALPFLVAVLTRATPSRETQTSPLTVNDLRRLRVPDLSQLATLLRLVRRAAFNVRTAAAAVCAMTVTMICEPFLLLDTGHFLSESDARSFLPSLQIAQGNLVRIWTLYDFSTTPYLYYVTHLLRDAMGRPLEIAALLGLVWWTLFRRNRTGWVMLAWLVPYFLLVAGLHTKPIHDPLAPHPGRFRSGPVRGRGRPASHALAPNPCSRPARPAIGHSHHRVWTGHRTDIR